jgi:dTDP-4-dehydrorhamnose reductase
MMLRQLYCGSRSVVGRDLCRKHSPFGVRLALVVRTSAFFSPWDEHNFVTSTLATLQSGRSVDAVDDCRVSPTYDPELVNAALDLLLDGEFGIWHLANRGDVSWAELARKVAAMAGLDGDGVRPRPATEMKLRARRPAYSVPGSERADIMPSLDDALARYFGARTTHLGEATSGCARASSEKR